MNSVIFWALDRAKEPSTWAGLAGLAMVFGVSAEQWSTIGTAVAAVAAAIAMFVSITYMLSLQLLVFCVEVMGIHALVAPLVVLGVFTPINFFCSKLALTGQWWRQD